MEVLKGSFFQGYTKIRIILPSWAPHQVPQTQEWQRSLVVPFYLLFCLQPVPCYHHLLDGSLGTRTFLRKNHWLGENPSCSLCSWILTCHARSFSWSPSSNPLPSQRHPSFLGGRGSAQGSSPCRTFWTQRSQRVPGSVQWFLGPAMNFLAHKDSWAGQPYIQCSIYSFHLAPCWTCAPLQHLCEKSIM